MNNSAFVTGIPLRRKVLVVRTLRHILIGNDTTVTELIKDLPRDNTSGKNQQMK